MRDFWTGQGYKLLERTCPMAAAWLHGHPGETCQEVPWRFEHRLDVPPAFDLSVVHFSLTLEAITFYLLALPMPRWKPAVKEGREASSPAVHSPGLSAEARFR